MCVRLEVNTKAWIMNNSLLRTHLTNLAIRRRRHVETSLEVAHPFVSESLSVCERGTCEIVL